MKIIKNTKKLATITLAISLLSSSSVGADTKIIQIGGGDKLEAAQGQIESNVIWLNDLLQQHSSQLINYYGSGNGVVKDVAYLDATRIDSGMEPIARVFGDIISNRTVFRHNQLKNLAGSTTKPELVEALSRIMQDVKSGEEVFIVYNGHGGINKFYTNNNHIRLWGKQTISVSEFDEILDKAPEDAIIRFVFPQCFSGAFYNLIYEDPWSNKLSKQNRCGFLAQSPYAESEGCSLSVNEDEFRDYTTYYFAPLYGKTRQGKVLLSDPDLNQDNMLSYREGHLYMLRNAKSKDLSRSTSEVYLEKWRPWYLFWDRRTGDANSIYLKLAEDVAQRNGLSMDDGKLDDALKSLNHEYENTENAIADVKGKISGLKNAIQKVLKLKWPELFHPYTEGYKKVITAELERVNAMIRQDQSYGELASLQDGQLQFADKKLDIQRKMAQIKKVVRYRKLARLESQFARYASKKERADYERLLSCEEGNLASIP